MYINLRCAPHTFAYFPFVLLSFSHSFFHFVIFASHTPPGFSPLSAALTFTRFLPCPPPPLLRRSTLSLRRLRRLSTLRLFLYFVFVVFVVFVAVSVVFVFVFVFHSFALVASFSLVRSQVVCFLSSRLSRLLLSFSPSSCCFISLFFLLFYFPSSTFHSKRNLTFIQFIHHQRERNNIRIAPKTERNISIFYLLLFPSNTLSLIPIKRRRCFFGNVINRLHKLLPYFNRQSLPHSTNSFAISNRRRLQNQFTYTTTFKYVRSCDTENPWC